MPFAVVRAHIAMLPRLQAREALRAVMITALGTGSLSKDDATATLRGWERIAHPSAVRRPVRPSPADLQRIGIQVVQVPPRG